MTIRRALRAFAIAVWLSLILLAVFNRRRFTLEAILHYTPESPLLAFFVLMAIFALKSLSVVFYAGFLYAAGGVLFPLPTALLVNLCGTLVMAAIPYLISRRIGVEHADELRRRYPKLRRLEQIRSRSPFAFVVALRCVNFVNFDVGSMYCGAVRMKPVSFLAASALGKAADIAVWSAMGTTFDRRDPVPFFIALGVDLTIVAAVVLWTERNHKEN